ncbi:MAG: hypothetical protein IPP42_21680 [Saprospiraceae bacterium]|nr:hypothetical protein [Saprospiraceae bacterium]
MLITIPSSFSPEIQYTFEILMQEFLGIDIKFIISPTAKDYILSADDMKSVKITNHFFSQITESAGYFKSGYLPRAIQYWSDATLTIQDLPVLYGLPRLEETNEGYILQADIISSSYFMLSRWEEVIDTQLDIHLRVQGKNSIANKYNFLHRPIVNEYADLLWTLLVKSGYRGQRKLHQYQAFATHDVDQPYQWPDWHTSLKHLGGDLLKRKDISLATTHIKSLYATKVKGKSDPFDQHQYLLDLAYKYQHQACFNFIVSNRSKFDQSLSSSDPRLKAMIDSIETAGHLIGYHPGYEVYLDQKIFNEELATLQLLVKQKIMAGRQHYLRFKVPDTWRLWDQASMEWESTLGYADIPGFRCGTCYTYTVFDCKAGKKMKVKEKPLILMDATLIYYQRNWDAGDLLQLKNECKKHGGEWVTLVHNDLVKHPALKELEELFYG